MENLQDKMRIIQELVPGKQITLAHIIANPDKILYQKLGLDPAKNHSGAIGIMTMSPSETAIIAGDIAAVEKHIRGINNKLEYKNIDNLVKKIVDEMYLTPEMIAFLVARER